MRKRLAAGAIKPAAKREKPVSPAMEPGCEPIPMGLVHISSKVNSTELSLCPSVLLKMKMYRSSAGSTIKLYGPSAYTLSRCSVL